MTRKEMIQQATKEAQQAVADNAACSDQRHKELLTFADEGIAVSQLAQDFLREAADTVREYIQDNG